MTEQPMRAVELLGREDLIGGDIEYRWTPDFSERGSHTHRYRIAKVEDGGERIIFRCEWVARLNKKEKVWKVARRRRRDFSISKKESQYPYENLHRRDDGSITEYVVGCPLPPALLSHTTIYPRGHKEVLDASIVVGL